jgi:hypothetical protein
MLVRGAGEVRPGNPVQLVGLAPRSTAPVPSVCDRVLSFVDI